MRKLLPLILILLGIGGGAGAGFALRPGQSETAEPGDCPAPTTSEQIAEAAPDPDTPDEGREYVKMNNQFVVPVMRDGRVAALVVLSLSVEVTLGQREAVYAKEPKLRDAFLQVLFDHANAGGFEGAFTNSNTLDRLRNALTEAAGKVMRGVVFDVLIVDIARQDN